MGPESHRLEPTHTILPWWCLCLCVRGLCYITNVLQPLLISRSFHNSADNRYVLETINCSKLLQLGIQKINRQRPFDSLVSGQGIKSLPSQHSSESSHPWALLNEHQMKSAQSPLLHNRIQQGSSLLPSLLRACVFADKTGQNFISSKSPPKCLFRLIFIILWNLWDWGCKVNIFTNVME